MLMGLTFVSVMHILGLAIHDYYSNKIHGKMALVGSSTFLWKILHLPMEFFNQRMAGDLQNRQNANSFIAGNLVVTVAPLMMNLIMVVFYLVVMLRYSWAMTLVGVASIAINLSLARIISAKRVNISRVQVRDMAKLDSATVAGVEMIETIKASGAENGYFEKNDTVFASRKASCPGIRFITHTICYLPYSLFCFLRYRITVIKRF